MLEVKTVARKWGNSLGIALPKDIVKKADIRPHKEVKVFIAEKNIDLSKIFGSLNIKKSTQEILDEIRKGEE